MREYPLMTMFSILFCVTLFFISKAVHHHRKANRPMQYNDNGVREEQKMHNISAPNGGYQS